MARQPRIEFEGALYHVTSRGNRGDDIFLENGERDRKKFLEILDRIKDRYGCLIHAYVLMPNHYHLLVETPRANLQQMMQNLNTSYTVFINKRYQRNGHLFQGRYKAIVVEKETYLLALSRYIHLNPVRAGMVHRPEAYPWSSYREYVGDWRSNFVDVRETLIRFSKNERRAIAGYREFVESGLQDLSSPFKDLKGGIVLGSEPFIEEKIKARILPRREDRELPAIRTVLKATPMEKVVETIADHFGVSLEELRRRSRRHAKERRWAIYLAKILGGEKNSAVGAYFQVTPQAVTNVLAEVEKEVSGSEETAEEFARLRAKCKM